MAYCGFGVWALVGQSLSSTLMRVFFFPVFTKWHPNRPFNLQSFHHLWGFGSKILVTGIIDVIVANLSNILIGRFYNKTQVGYFTKARSLSDIPAMTMSSVLGTVLYPVLSEIHNDETRHATVYKRVSRNAVLFTFPVMILIALLAKPIIIILFTEKWAPAIPLLQALLLARCFLTLNIINANMLQSRGDTKLYMNLYIITGIVSLVAVVASIPLGVQAMAWATFISGLFYYALFAIVIDKKIGYSFLQQLWDWRMIFLSLILMSICVFFSIHWISNFWVQLLMGTLVGACVYLGCCMNFHLFDQDMIKAIKTKLGIKF